MSHSWLPKSRSTTELFLAVGCYWNTQRLPNTLGSESHQVRGGMTQNQAAGCQGTISQKGLFQVYVRYQSGVRAGCVWSHSADEPSTGGMLGFSKEPPVSLI